MKRILVLFLFIAIAIGSIYAWMILRPRPDTLLKASLRRLTSVTIVPVQSTLQWEYADKTEMIFQFGGWTSYSGILDLRDLSVIRGNGMAGYSSTVNQADFETANVVLTKDYFAFQEKQFKDDRSEWLKGLVATTTTSDTWFKVDRERLFSELGYPSVQAQGSGADIRKILQQVDIRKWMTIVSSSEQLYLGREYMSIRVKINEDEFFSGLLALISSWKKSNPTQDDIVWAKKISKNAAHSEWEFMIDEGAREIVSITGKWQNVDSQEKVLGRATLTVVLGEGLSGKASSATISKDAIDLTSALFAPKKGTLPVSSDRRYLSPDVGLNEASSTSTIKE